MERKAFLHRIFSRRLCEGLTMLINLKELYLNDTLLEFLPGNFGR